MSLTSHISGPRSRSSLVRAWFERELPATAGLAKTSNRHIKASSPGLIAPVDGADPAVVGTAVDFLLRVSLSKDALTDTAAARGAATLDAVWRGTVASEFLEHAVRAVTARAPWQERLPDDQWSEVCRACLVLARFEQAYRAPGARGGPTALLLRQAAGQYDRLLDLVASGASADDLARLGRAVVDDHEDLRVADRLILNPEFALARRLRGADGDLIAGPLLLDLKGTRGNPVGRTALWQLVGYALADTDDEFGLREVGISALRWRTRITWPLEDLLTELSGRKQSLETWRASFVDAVDLDERERAARRATLLAARDARRRANAEVASSATRTADAANT